MRPFQPMTLLVVTALAACLVAGLWMLLRVARRSRSAEHRCGQCGLVNRSTAKFCSRCGAAMRPPDQEKGTTHA